MPVALDVNGRPQDQRRSKSKPSDQHHKELPAADVDDLVDHRCRRNGPSRANSASSRPSALTVRCGAVLHQRLADSDHSNHSSHHRVPIAAQIGSNVGRGAAVTTDLQRRPPRRPCRQRARARADPLAPTS